MTTFRKRPLQLTHYHAKYIACDLTHCLPSDSAKQLILVITPSNLRKLWLQDLTEKFFLLCHMFETNSYIGAVRQSRFHQFVSPDIGIGSCQVAKSRAADGKNLPKTPLKPEQQVLYDEEVV